MYWLSLDKNLVISGFLTLANALVYRRIYDYTFSIRVSFGSSKLELFIVNVFMHWSTNCSLISGKERLDLNLKSIYALIKLYKSIVSSCCCRTSFSMSSMIDWQLLFFNNPFKGHLMVLIDEGSLSTKTHVLFAIFEWIVRGL